MEINETSTKDLDSAVAALKSQQSKWSLQQKIALIDQTIDCTFHASQRWVAAAHKAKSIPAGSAAAVEDILTGPLATLRFLRLVRSTFADIVRDGKPRLPKQPSLVGGQVCVDVFPTKWLSDATFFGGATAQTYLDSSVTIDNVFDDSLQTLKTGAVVNGIIVVLGAGNVAAIPITDALSKTLLENHAVILKMNPVNDYLGPIFEQALKPFIDANLIRIVYGGAAQGSYLVCHPDTHSVHITGSADSHDRIVWGDPDQQAARKREGTPVLDKEITSELSNVSPWAILPSNYTAKELDAIAENVAASITNNASFNCVATKVVVTSRGWAQRQEFLTLLQTKFDATPQRAAYYPGANQRYERFAGQAAPDSNQLPWKLVADVDLDSKPWLVAEESFTCVCAEVALEADTEVAFLDSAVQFMNERTWGTLAATLTVSDAFQETNAESLGQAIGALRFGTIGINLWPALAFAWMSPPWGGYPGATLADVKSGIGFVHNTFLLRQPEKTVIRGPLTTFPKPIWFTNHRQPEKLAWRTLKYYWRPSIWRLPSVSVAALTG